MSRGWSREEIRFPRVEIALLPVWGAVLTLGYVAWMTNLYNFMDGFAGGMAVIGFSTLAALALPVGDFQYAAINGIIAAAVAGFLIWNFPPARIFMGDAGITSFLPLGCPALNIPRPARPTTEPVLDEHRIPG